MAALAAILVLPVGVVADAPEPPAFLGRSTPPAAILDRLVDAPILWFEPVGRTTVVFRVVFEGGGKGLFEPSTRQHPAGHRAEVAAYRVARLLGLDGVPPAITRRVAREDLRARLDPELEDAWAPIARWTNWSADGWVAGAAIDWVPDARALGLERHEAVRRWSRWLSQEGRVPEDGRALARDLSNMVVFDYLIGHWERLGRGGIEGTPDGARLYLRDHNKAFAAPLPPVLHRRTADGLLRSEKFSRGLVERLARLDADALRAELARDPGHAAGAPLLTAAQVAGVMDRREAILSYVGALIDEHGEEAVLVFP
ncbi:MAG: hypothetical protein ACODAU_00760 [Myxococcota bacterium]